jgi:hypothetical protein
MAESYYSHFERRTIGIKKLFGKSVIVRPLGHEPPPHKDPDKDNLIYVPIPEYDIGLWYYTPTIEGEDTNEVQNS